MPQPCEVTRQLKGSALFHHQVGPGNASSLAENIFTTNLQNFVNRKWGSGPTFYTKYLGKMVKWSLCFFFLPLRQLHYLKNLIFDHHSFLEKNRLSRLHLVKRRKTTKLNSKKIPSMVEVNTSFNSPSSSPRGEKRKDITKCLTLPKFQSH